MPVDWHETLLKTEKVSKKSHMDWFTMTEKHVRVGKDMIYVDTETWSKVIPEPT